MSQVLHLLVPSLLRMD
uniref:Uncharacterized protein n=1 Tax=Anguilla anguilla TaxID=7936 RepID=A0A0E9UXZ0_ANGAN